MTQTIVPIILSGGAGTRLWPMSRESHPKPFIKLPNGNSLLQETLLRIFAIPDSTSPYIITNKEYYLKTQAELDQLNLTQPVNMRYILEPFGNNTAPAIAIAALAAKEQYGDDAILLVLPSDHLIEPRDAFIHACQYAINSAKHDNIVTFGVTPTRAETGYGYIEVDNASGDSSSVKAIKQFTEKPDLHVAESYLTSGRHYWNAGIFCFSVKTILSAYQILQPVILTCANKCWQNKTMQNQAVLLDEATFKQIENISIDYAILEKSKNLSMVTCDFSWQDIGSWESYKALFGEDNKGNTVLGDAVLIDSANNLICGEGRMITSIGINNLAIIDTPDAVLITPRDRAQDVKQVVQTLKNKSHESYLIHKTVIRPWGKYTVLEEGHHFKIKRIEVNPGASLSLQLHQKRSEHWVVVEGTASVMVDEKAFTLQTNESTFVPINTKHRLANATCEPLIIIEVQTGHYLGEDDITRFDDDYGRDSL